MNKDDKIKLSPAQKRLILTNIFNYLSNEDLKPGHYKTWEYLERKNIFFMDDDINIHFTEKARERLLGVGVDIFGSESVRALRLDPVFLNYRKWTHIWDKLPGGSDKLDEIYDKYEKSIEDAGCIFDTLHEHVTKFTKKVKIPDMI